MGFSRSTLLPASSAATAISACVSLRVHTLTASISGEARSSRWSVVTRVAPVSAARRAARSASTSQMPATTTSGFWA
ncbi:hypothetical protein CMsap09_00205 [Clavibacter michiganensis]|uniref:Uncharacterized protein n=1 Tax=Clavibacter michiganensis TaxID=28447 RepID=A0A251XP82_9MICO|nr:hypothetical protein CMsap09_00205 [Clavibacter michiganensis]